MAHDTGAAGGAAGEASAQEPASATADDELAVSLSRLARTLHQQDDPASTLTGEQA